MLVILTETRRDMEMENRTIRISCQVHQCIGILTEGLEEPMNGLSLFISVLLFLLMLDVSLLFD